jgi:transcription initiation factor TFIIE subunit alpha
MVPGMDVAVELVRVVARSLYEDKYAVLLDILLRDKMYSTWSDRSNLFSISDEGVAERMQLMVKDVGKIAAKLKEDRLIKSEVRLESRGPEERPFNRTFYYIDLATFADVVKYRLHMMRKTLEDRVKNDVNEKGYHCPRCNRTYSVMDVGKLFHPTTNELHCEVCSAELQSVDQSMLSTDSSRQSKLIEQTNHILRLLRRIDEFHIPRFDPIEYLKARDSIDLQVTSPKDSSSDVSSISGRSFELRVAGADAKEKELQVEILSTNIPEAETRNEMPVWHTHSTVTGQQIQGSIVSTASPESAASTLSASKETTDYVKYYEAMQMNPMSIPKKPRTEALESNESIKKSPQAEEVPDNFPTEETLEGTPTEGMLEKSQKGKVSKDCQAEETTPMVSVQGVIKPLSTVTDDDKNNMTEEEYQKYYEAYSALDLE